MPRVLFVAPSAYPLGGVQVWLDYLLRSLPGTGWEPAIGLAAGRCHDSQAYLRAHADLPAFPIVNATGSHEGRIRAIEGALARWRPDVVVGVNIVDVYSAASRARRRGQALKVVFTLHGIEADLLDDIRRESQVLDAVIATNRLACRMCVVHAGMQPDRVLYAPYGVDMEQVAGVARASPRAMLRIAWVGRFDQRQKRVDDIAGILPELDRLGIEYRLTLTGDGPDRDRLLRSLAPWVQNGRVNYVGALPAADLAAKVYADADALLVTSSWETGPIVVWEAMAAGVAVVTSRYVGLGLEDALHDGDNCLTFPVGACADAARQLARLAADSALAQALTRAGRNLVATRYSVAKSVAAWASCLSVVRQLPQRSAPLASQVPAPAGRLDRLLGVPWAETVRARLGISHRHSDAGGEWPHTYARSAPADAFLTCAARLDQRVE